MRLCLAFLLSGCAALLFETLWFRQAGLMLGNSVWASSLVLAAFMAGLGAGNVWAARRGDRVRRPVLTYAFLEVLVGLTGLALVLAFPVLTGISAPLFGWLLPHPFSLNAGRALLALALMAIPATAMGMTLPLLVRALSVREPVFGRALGRLYGWNTLGAVLGALAGEGLLVPWLGLRATGGLAAALNLLAGLLALSAARGLDGLAAPASRPSASRDRRALRFLAAAFLAGGTFMALEVVWFRFLLLFLYGTSATFAAMLASVLLGIALGGFSASRLLAARPLAAERANLVAAASGIAVVLTYAGFADALPEAPGIVVDDAAILRLSLTLMLPASWLSGMLFTLLGAGLKSRDRDEAWTAGSLTLANTAGAALGALLAGFGLIPRLGVEGSFFALALAYGVIALLLPLARGAGRLRWLLPAAAAAYLVIVGLFPFGLMRNGYLKRLPQPGGSRVVAFREGVSETLTYLRTDLWDTATSHRLVTNGFSMSATGMLGQRYMRMFVDWPRAVHPAARRALLISFGVGTTARALVDTRSLDRIDVVDISRDVLEMGRVVFEGVPYPLDDPRVRVHVEDGRFFLLTTGQRFDIITAEPPPLKYAGIVNLYSREYFHLVRDRLDAGGVATYWLPVYQATPRESRSLVAAFCDAFPDCSLWTGSGPEWMLAGTRDARGPVEEAAFSRPWQEDPTAAALRDSGLEGPEQLGATFIADGDDLRSWVAGAPPLEDDKPGRLARAFVGVGSPHIAEYAAFMDTRDTRRRFARSATIARLWPEALRGRTLLAFDDQARVNGVFLRPYLGLPTRGALPELAAALTGSHARMPVLWLMGSGADEQRAADVARARGLQQPMLDEFLGIEAMASRDYRRAEELLARAEPFAAHGSRIRRWRILALALADDLEAARALMPPAPGRAEPQAVDAADWQWLSERLAPSRP